MERAYTEYDLVFKGDTVNDVISQYQEFIKDAIGEDPPEGLRGELSRILKAAEKDKKRSRSSGLEIDAVFDRERGEYLLIKPDTYSASNLLYVLFDILVEHPQGEPAELQREAAELIDRYIRRIEQQEGMSFLGQREDLKKISGEMVQTMAILDEEDFKEEDLERLSEEIDKNYYEPLGMILQSILIDIIPASAD